FYRKENKIAQGSEKISVIVQKMIQSETSGVMFSIDPVTNQKDRIVIEAVWGLGEMIVQGSVVPDTYVVQKETFSILSKEISDQSTQLTRKGIITKEGNVPKKLIAVQKISDDDIVFLAKLADKLHKHYYFPQDIEWAKEKGKVYIVQTRPVTTVNANKQRSVNDEGIKISKAPILTGAPASPGIGTGPVKILKSPKEISKISKDDVLVASMTSPDYVPAMKKAAAIITDQGGQTSHAAIVSRELGIPCVVGTKNATKILKDGDIVTVDGGQGKIYLGAKIKVLQIKEVEQAVRAKKLKTATKVYVNLAETEKAVQVSKMNVDGVGLLRAEFIMANIGIHPKEAIKRKVQDKYIQRLSDDLTTFCKSFHPRPVVYRATDFKTNEYRSLEGGKFWEPQEPNPMLGYRGAIRYISDPEVFNLELSAIKNVREKYDNLHLMIPFVRSPEELAKVRRLVATEGLFDKSTFMFWMMVELPVNVILLEDFIKVGIDGISIGSNDLTMLIEGTDRDNAEVSQAFNELSPAVLWAIKRVIRICNKHNISSSICGQSVSSYDSLVELLVKKGITSVSVNPDAINRVRSVIYEMEKNI
ncbi:MAG: phosphoenolpyruvate synthase, partial [bacterium]|nr:phosphoenolpyruvate synthase [bacterium]